MAQQINLYDPAQRPRSEPYSSGHGLVLAGLVALVTGLASIGLHWLAQRERLAARDSTDLSALAKQRAGSDAARREAIAELAQLRAVEASQRRVRALLETDVHQAAQGYAELFAALSRQAHPALWITGLAVSGDGQSLELAGRMLDASALPDYLRRLNAEPQFKGRPFAALDLKVVDPSAAATTGGGYTEFSLRSLPGHPDLAK